MASPVMTLVGGALSAAGTIAEGRAAYASAQAEGKQLNRMATEQMALATRGMDAKSREEQLLLSRGQAVSAASGGGTGGSVLDLVGNIARDANVQERDILREGTNRSNDLRYKGRVGVANAKFNRGLSYVSAAGTMLSAASKAAEQAASAGSGASGGSSTPWWG